MPADDVARALMAMDDDDVRARVASGDFDDLAALALTDNERALVRAAAADDPEASGYILCTAINRAAVINCNGLSRSGSPFGDAAHYARQGISPNRSAAFTNWLSEKQAQGGGF